MLHVCFHNIYIKTKLTILQRKSEMKQLQNNISFHGKKEKCIINNLSSTWSFNFLVILQLTLKI